MYLYHSQWHIWVCMWVYFMCDANVYNKGEGGCLKDKFAPFAKKMCPFCKKKGFLLALQNRSSRAIFNSRREHFLCPPSTNFDKGSFPNGMIPSLWTGVLMIRTWMILIFMRGSIKLWLNWAKLIWYIKTERGITMDRCYIWYLS